MTPQESDLMHGHADACRRRAFLECVVGVALLPVAVICAARGEPWHTLPVALLAGGFLSAAVFTFVHGRHWARVAAKRDRNVSKEGE